MYRRRRDDTPCGYPSNSPTRNSLSSSAYYMSFPDFRQLALLCRRTAQICINILPPCHVPSAASSTRTPSRRPESGVALVTPNRPEALNALNSALFAELNEALRLIDGDGEIRAIIVISSERAIAGACTRGFEAVLEHYGRQPVPI
ncbi:hypothetical protein BJY52DRAFT_1274100 [Lactarius psammicola]|nr:hypothetical protein BJY52DRAFT_1274100 [Lactarius psammicola]